MGIEEFKQALGGEIVGRTGDSWWECLECPNGSGTSTAPYLAMAALYRHRRECHSNKKKGNQMPASNTRECFTACVGQKIIGVLFDALPNSRTDIAIGTKTLVFEDGSGLTISSGGSFWMENENEVKKAVKAKWSELQSTVQTLEAVLKLAEGLGLSDD